MTDNDVIEKGKLWSAFKNTEYAVDLDQFFNDQEKLGRDAVCDLTMAGKHEEAKAAAHKMTGILVVREYISDCISGMLEMVEIEKEEKRYRKAIPKHV